MTILTFDQLITHTAKNTPEAIALHRKDEQLSYQALSNYVNKFATALLGHQLKLAERVAIYLPKQFETVISMFATTLAGGVFVPVNPLLKPAQVSYIFNNCQVSVLVTSLSRYKQLQSVLETIKSIHTIVLTDCKQQICPEQCIKWEDFIAVPFMTVPLIDVTSTPSKLKFPLATPEKMAAILYTSGSTGQPKGVMLSHINLLEGAKSVSHYLNNTSQDKILAVLPFSFDYGLSQLTTAFLSGASVVLLEYLLPRDVINAVVKYRITGLAAVPPLWIRLAEFNWPQEASSYLRYITNSGGAMPQTTLDKLLKQLPNTLPYLMYGLTEAFRSTYLDPIEIKNRLGSMGKAIPNAEILLINDHGDICQSDEEGELVHKGPHVALGYWQAEQKTAEKFRALPIKLHSQFGSQVVVWSGDRVKRDIDGFLYFIGRNDDMIKSSGYRISPAELEETLYSNEQINEVAAIGLPHDRLGHEILLVIKPQNMLTFDEIQLRKDCKKLLPNYMQPHVIKIVNSLPRNHNGKINRQKLFDQYK
jgi:acyl-CoA ligase (AMP-forming) (exosortase A-associated)